MSLTLRESKSASYGRYLKTLSLIEKRACKDESPPPPDTTPILESRADKFRVWREFPKQSLAIDFSNTCRYSVGVFSFESAKFGTSGQRHFIVSAYHTFVHRYLDELIKIDAPHFYEVIVEGAVCKLYFDIEYQKLLNPSVNGVKLLDIFIQYVNFCLSHFYEIVCDRQNVLDLDSSSEKKFSRHLIYHTPDAVFHSNRELGKFVTFICDELRYLRSTGSFRVLSPKESASNKLLSWRSKDVECPDKDSLLQLFILNDKGSEVLICDEGVYSKNRNFRLYLSSKLGKDITLQISNENKFVPIPSKSYQVDASTLLKQKHINYLYNSLIAYLPYDHSIRILSFDNPISSEKPSTSPHDSTDTESPPVEFQDSSPYPPLDAFIRFLVTRDGSPGRIRRVSYFPEGKLVIFDITGYRYCENVQRHHKSNNIMLLASLEKLTYYQKCHDPDCKNVQFKSSEMPIPPKVVSECFHRPEDDFQDLDMQMFESDFDNNDGKEIGGDFKENVGEDIGGHFDDHDGKEIGGDFDENVGEDIGEEEWGRILEEMETSVTYYTEP